MVFKYNDIHDIQNDNMYWIKISKNFQLKYYLLGINKIKEKIWKILALFNSFHSIQMAHSPLSSCSTSIGFRAVQLLYLPISSVYTIYYYRNVKHFSLNFDNNNKKKIPWTSEGKY